MRFRRITARQPTTLTPNRRGQRKVRKDKGNIQLTNRDIHVLVWIGEQYGARLDQVRLLLERVGAGAPKPISQSAVIQLTRRWRRAGLVDTRKVLAHELAWVYLTEKGIRSLLDRPYRIWRPTPASVTHCAQVNWVRLALEARHPTWRWIGERALLHHRIDRHAHIADGALETPEGMIAIEVELTPKSVMAIEDTLAQLVVDYELVWYFTSSATRGRVERALTHLSTAEQGLFHLFDLAEVA
jgi:hypothetical protein